MYLTAGIIANAKKSDTASMRINVCVRNTMTKPRVTSNPTPTIFHSDCHTNSFTHRGRPEVDSAGASAFACAAAATSSGTVTSAPVQPSCRTESSLSAMSIASVCCYLPIQAWAGAGPAPTPESGVIDARPGQFVSTASGPFPSSQTAPSSTASDRSAWVSAVPAKLALVRSAPVKFVPRRAMMR